MSVLQEVLLQASESMFNELFAAVSIVIWNRHGDLPSPVPWHWQPREPLRGTVFELDGEVLRFSLTCKTEASGAEQHRWEVPQLIASAELTFTEPLVVQTVSGSCSSEAWNWQLVFQLSPRKVGKRILCKTLFMQEFFHLNTYLKISNFGNAQRLGKGLLPFHRYCICS